MWKSSACLLDTERVTYKSAMLRAAETSRTDSRTFSCVVAACNHRTLSDVLESRAQFTSWEHHQVNMTVLAVLQSKTRSQRHRNIRWCSASRLFVFHNVSSFSAIIRKLVYSLLCSLRDSNNLLVCAMLHSDICLQSSLFKRWHKLYFSSSFFLIVFNHSTLYIVHLFHGLWACYWNKLNWNWIRPMVFTWSRLNRTVLRDGQPHGQTYRQIEPLNHSVTWRAWKQYLLLSKVKVLGVA